MYIYIYIKFVKEEKNNSSVIAILQLTSITQQMWNRATLLEHWNIFFNFFNFFSYCYPKPNYNHILLYYTNVILITIIITIITLVIINIIIIISESLRIKIITILGTLASGL